MICNICCSQVAPIHEICDSDGLDVQGNDIASLKRITATVECTQRISICRLLGLGGDPVFEMIVESAAETQKKDPRGKDEVEALATILTVCKNIKEIALDMYRDNLPPKIRFLLGFNQSKAKWLMGKSKGMVFPPPRQVRAVLGRPVDPTAAGFLQLHYNLYPLGPKRNSVVSRLFGASRLRLPSYKSTGSFRKKTMIAAAKDASRAKSLSFIKQSDRMHSKKSHNCLTV